MSWLPETLLATTVLMIVVILMRGPVARRFGARAAYSLWLAPLARLILPPFAVEISSERTEVDLAEAVAVTLPTTASSFPPTLILLALWAAGAAAFLIWHIVAYRRFLADALRRGHVLSSGTEAGIKLIATEAISGPAAAGLLNRYIFVPIDFEDRFSGEQQDIALCHETLHHRRGDIWAGAAALVMLSLHWFNPVAHHAYRLFRRDLESACDATLIDLRGPDCRHLYAGTILRCAGKAVPETICALTPIGDLKERLNMLNMDHSRARQLAGGALALVLASAGLGLAAPVAAQESEPLRERVEIRRTVSDGKDGDHVRRALPRDLEARMAKCDGEKFETDVVSEPTSPDTKKARTKLLICAKAGTSKADAAASLEKVLSRVEGDSDMPAENKAQVVAKLKARIAELKAGI